MQLHIPTVFPAVHVSDTAALSPLRLFRTIFGDASTGALTHSEHKSDTTGIEKRH
jgi:hypothetical protein